MAKRHRGSFVDRVTQRWVRASGRRIDLAEHPWLDGPIGNVDKIESEFFELHAKREHLEIASADRDRSATTVLLPEDY